MIGCDLHTRYQHLAMLDTETGELVERRLEHENSEASAFYESLARERANRRTGSASRVGCAAANPAAPGTLTRTCAQKRLTRPTLL